MQYTVFIQSNSIDSRIRKKLILMIQFGYLLRQEDILNDFVVLLDDTSVNCVETTVGVWLKAREK